MANVELTQAEADALLEMDKCKADDRAWDYPGLAGGTLSIPLLSRDRRESFLLDVGRSGTIVLKGKYQNRARQTFILARLDFGGSPHRNPDGGELSALICISTKRVTAVSGHIRYRQRHLETRRMYGRRSWTSWRSATSWNHRSSTRCC